MRWSMLVCVALILAACGGNRAANEPVANKPANAPPAEKLEYERVALAKLTTRDPPYLWPRDKMRLAATEFWVIWKTNEFVPGQLIATKDEKLWYDLGQSAASLHYLPADLAKFDSALTFCVEFEEEGERFRSKPRSVRFGAGVRFAQRRLQCVVERAENQTFWVRTEAGDLQGLTTEDFRFALLPESMTIYGRPHRESESSGRLELVIDGRTVPGKGCTGFWEIRDSRTDTWDRLLLEITVK